MTNERLVKKREGDLVKNMDRERLNKKRKGDFQKKKLLSWW